ncbi:hypothetical protein [Streptomyces sp. NPDC020983]|uniref:hypothetical protein n=1 Tax=Streptomyces sp. NPDC020983 TaxID=3365106 RepID=UPI00379020E4
MADGAQGAGPERRRERGRNRRRDVIATVIACAAVAAAIVHMVRPGLRIDGVTVVLLAVAVVPWLGELFDSIELPGGTKLQYRQLAERVEAAEERSAQAGRTADDASRTARIALVTRGGEDTAAPGAFTDTSAGSRGSGAVERLAEEYASLREHAPRSPARTDRMEQIFADLVTATRRQDDFGVGAALASAAPGIRLAAYARLYARPDGGYLDQLTQAVLDDGAIAFNQYWGFHAILAVVGTAGAGRMRVDHVAQLEACLLRLPPDSDRSAVLRRLLAGIRRAADPAGR